MADKKFPSSGLPVRKTHELLPSIFQTEANKKFMSAAVDPLVQPGSLQKVVGYVGKRYGKTYNGNDVYLDNDTTLRSRYQLESAVVVKNHGNVENFYDYLDFKNQLKFFGNNNDRDDIINSQENYSWNPPIDWDKFVNYREYFWEPLGPPPVEVLGQSPEITSTYRVKLGIGSSFIFTPDGLTNNPSIVLYRGQTYKFVVNVPKDGFVIRRNYDTGSLTFNPDKIYFPGELAFYDGKLFRARVEINPIDSSSIDLESQDWEFIEDITNESSILTYDKGVTNNGAEIGTITFTVPYDAPEILYYQSKIDPNRLGRFVIGDIESNTKIDIEREIIGKKTYTSSNGVAFTNNLVVRFPGQVFPEKYSRDTWLIEGVGKEITLTRFADLVVPVLTTDVPEVLFDNEGFDAQPFDDASSYPSQKDYITISRNSKDLNPWSRYNRWFHRSVLEYAYSFRNQDFQASEASRAKRPIIEFKPNLKLFSHGGIAKETVDYIDDFTEDVFSNIEGSTSYNVDGEFLFEGARLLITADKDRLVNNKIYRVRFITHNGRRQIHLAEDTDSNSILDQGVLVGRGSSNGGLMYHFALVPVFDQTGLNVIGKEEKWIASQRKIKVNQPPLFDAFDEQGVSFADAETYPVTDFVGTKLFSYKVGNGTADRELGFSLSYLNIDNVGDIQFSWDWDSQEVSYIIDRQIRRSKISSGYFSLEDQFDNGWILNSSDYLQPIFDSKVIEETTNTVSFNTVDWNIFDQNINNKIIFFVNGKKYEGQYQRTFTNFVFDNNFKSGDVVSLKLISNQVPIEGYYEIPVGLEKNPLNNDLIDFTFGQAVDHVGSGLEFFEEFDSNIPGVSNLRDIDGYQNNCKRFLKHSGLIPLSVFFLTDKNYNLIKSLQYAKKSYSEFKNNFLKKSLEIDYNDSIPNFVDDILSDLTKVKTVDSPFSDSDMLGTGAFTAIVYNVQDDAIKTFSLNEKFSLNELSRRAVYVYLNQRQLLHEKDYVFNNTFGFITLKSAINLNDVVEIREYISTAVNHIPPTPSKLGLYKKFVPMKFIDDTYREPKEVIQGHDGSITFAFGDFRDDLLLELEYRIYNNIKTEYDENVFNLDATVGGYYGNALYNKTDVDSIVSQEFLKWIQNTNINYTNNDYFVENETFTYTYSNMTDPTGTQNLPGYWRGVYQWFYDTDRPHRCPWEMVGFSEKPSWWESEYGPAPYTSGNLILWEDLRDGIIRQGTRSGQYDRYARPSLLKHIPVDSDGNLLSPLDSGLAGNFTLINNKGSFKLGDISPVEYAWRSSSEWPFALIIAISLLKPFEFIPDNLNRARVKINRVGQTVSASTNKFMTLSDVSSVNLDNDLISGLLKYVVAYVKSKGSSTQELSNKISNIDVNLSHRISGFANKNQFRYLLDSKNPRSTSGSVFVPPENYDIIFNVSTPISNVTYSGVIVEKTEGGWILSGYDDIAPYFTYYEAIPNQKDPLIDVGGISEKFTEWEAAKNYVNGQVVRYRGDYYRALRSHNSEDSFEVTNWKKLPGLTVINSVQALKRRNFNTLKTKIMSYGTKLSSIQQVVDFLLGYEFYLKSIGLIFDNYDVENKVSKDWTTSCKEFMFWTKHNWALGSLLALSPSSEKINISVPVGVADNFLDGFYDYQILKSDGKPLLPSLINVSRDFQNITVETTNTTDGIYFLKAYFVLKENVTLFSDRTVFNDIIYDKTSGYRQERIKVQGFRTVDWDGDYTSPGFLFDNVNIQAWQPFKDYRLGDIVSYRSFNWTSQENQTGTETFDDTKWSKLDSKPEKQLVANFDYKVNQFEDYFETSSEGLGDNERKLAQHTIGYQVREYLQNLAEDPVTQFQLYQGFIREKGTINSAKKIFSKLSRSGDDSIILNEEWAIRTGRFGGSDQLTEIELQLVKDNFQLEPQPILTVENKPNVEIDQYYRVVSSDFTISPDQFDINFIPVSFDSEGAKTAGYVSVGDVDHIVAEYDDILDFDIDDIKENDHIWVTFYFNSWSVFRANQSPILRIENAVKQQDIVIITLNRRHNIQINDIVGIDKIENLRGFFKVVSVGVFDISVSIDENSQDPSAEFSTFLPIMLFTESRFSSYRDLDLQEAALLKNNSRLWVDDAGTGQWEVIKKQKLYNDIGLIDYGITEPLSTGYKVVYDDIRKTIITSVPGSGHVMVYIKRNNDLIVKQILEPSDSLRNSVSGTFGKSLAISPDGRWLIIGAPEASGIPSNFKGDYNASTSYQEEDIVLYTGKLFKANKNTIGDGSSINVYTEDWSPCQIINADVDGSNAGYNGQGVIFVYEYRDQQWNFNQAIISPRPAISEKFGFNVAIGVSGNQYTMAVSATGSLDNIGRVYLYTYDGEWKHLENTRYKGVYDPGGPVLSSNLTIGREYRIDSIGTTDFTLVGASSNSPGVYFIATGTTEGTGIAESNLVYYAGDIVWSNGELWECLADSTTDDGSTISLDSEAWKKIDPISTHVSLPTNIALDDDGSTLAMGLLSESQLAEIIKQGDGFGFSVSMNRDASVLAISAPNADGQFFTNYRGNWRPDIEYIEGDVVKYDNQYHRLNQRIGEPADSTTRSYNEIPTSLPWENVGDSSSEPSGKIFVYRRSIYDVYNLVQTINAETLPLLNDLDSGQTRIYSGDQFGFSIDIDNSGTILLATSPKADINFQNQGSAYIFKTDFLNNIEYRLKQKIESYEKYPNEDFGQSIAISPDTSKIVVGARNSPYTTYTRFDVIQGTTFDQGRSTFVDRSGYAGGVYVYELKDDRYFLTEKLESELSPFESFGHSVDVSNSVVVVGSPDYRQPLPHGVIIAYEGPKVGNVRLFEKQIDADSWTSIRNQVPATEIDKIKSIELYDNINSIKIQDLDYIDPPKLKILNSAEQEIKFKTWYDPATYSLGSDDHVVDETLAWAEKHVGELWWDISKAKWLHHEQGDIAHRIGNFGILAQGASIDVYEWVESLLLPSEWAVLADTNEGIAEGISGQPLYPNDDVYSVKVLYSPATGLPTSTKYFYWVKNSVIVPSGIIGRRISASEVSRLIENPAGSGNSFLSFIDKNKFLFYNFNSIVSSDTALLNIQFYKSTKNINPTHNEYQLLTEGDYTSLPNYQIENKWIDSLVGSDLAGNKIPDPNLPEKQKYGLQIRPRQSMFRDRISILKTSIININKVLYKAPFADIVDFRNLNLADPLPSENLNLYDVSVDSDTDLITVGTTRVRRAVFSANIVNGELDTVDVVDVGFGYKIPPSVEIEGNGQGAKISVSIDNQGRIDPASVTVLQRGRKYFNIDIQPRNFSVLVKTDSSSNNRWSIYAWDDRRKSFFKSRTQTFDTTRYWQLIDWWEENFSEKNRVVKEIANVYEESEIETQLGDLIRIKEYGSGGWAVFSKINNDNNLSFLERYRLIGREKGTIELLSSLYEPSLSGIGYDTQRSFDATFYDLDNSLELRNILRAVKEDIFINEYAVEWNLLFFTSLRYVFSEQKNIDWAFKTSFINAIHNVGPFEQKISYRNDNLESFQQYIDEIKPYRTTIREYVSRYDNVEINNSATSDFDLPAIYDDTEGKIIPITTNSDFINQYPWKWWKDNNGFSIVEIIVSNPGQGYTVAPRVLVEGNGTQVEAIAFVSNGKISGIQIINPGKGYTNTPTVTLIGGGRPTILAQAVAILGNSLIRTFDLSIKFDRLSKEGRFNSFEKSETFVASGTSSVFDLRFAPTNDKTRISVLKNSQIVLSNEYNVTFYYSSITGFSELKGKLIFTEVPESGSIITINYDINIELLDSVNRIEKFYTPVSGMKGKDLSQLMTGIDFGGVQIQGTTFDVTGGWDALPWFTDNWDSVESSSDYYIVVDGSTNFVTLPYIPADGQQITIYLKRAGPATPGSAPGPRDRTNVSGLLTRIDDPNYTDAWDSSVATNPNAQMPTFIGDGSTNIIEIGQYVQTVAGDILIFRPIESDGSVTINDPNILDTQISGGSLSAMSGAYATATGQTPEEIIIEGGKFVGPDQVPAPEENIPGQVLENVSIKVYTTSLSGAAPLLSTIRISDGETRLYPIEMKIIENNSILVYVDKIKRNLGSGSLDYSIDLQTNVVEFVTAPDINQVIEIFSIGIGGLNLLDYQEFTADGETNLFLTGASYTDTSSIFVTVDGEYVDTNFVNSSEFTSTQGRVLVQFGISPISGSVIKILCLKASTDVDSTGLPVIRINQQNVIYDGSTRGFDLDNFVNLQRASALSSMIVEINGTALTSVDTVYFEYNGITNQFIIGADPEEGPGVVLPSDIKVFINNELKTFITDYDYDGNTKVLTIFPDVLSTGDKIKIENSLRSNYSVVGNGIEISSNVALNEGDIISVIWFSEYPSMDLTSDEYTGGKVNYILPFEPLSVGFVWVYKNGQRLTKDVDFYLSSSNKSIYLKNSTTASDRIKIISFGSDVFKLPSAYEINKDMLNFYHYRRYSVDNLRLEKDLNYYDTEIFVNDASSLNDPIADKNIPGLITIDGEKIEYFEKSGNILRKLRRGAYGTAVKEIHSQGQKIVDSGRSEIIPYNETQERVDFVSDGSSLLIGPLDFIPTKTNISGWYRETIPQEYGRSDEVEIFVGGKRLFKDSLSIYDENISSSSPAGDKTVEAEFSVNGSSPYIRLTTIPPAGTRISIIKRIGKIWYDRGIGTASSGKTFVDNSSAIAKFIVQKSTSLPE
jgi:hypothetical protein